MGFLTSIPMFLAAAAAPPAPDAAAAAAPAPAAAATVGRELTVGLHRDGSTFAQAQDNLFWFITWLCVFFFVLLMGLAFGFVLKYRRRAGVAQQRSASHNTPLELAWSLGPLAILIAIFFWGFNLYMEMHLAPANAEEINVTARRWAWTWEYDNGALGLQTELVANQQSPVFAIPAGRPIKLIMHSTDVIHSSYIPDFRVKLDVFPMRYTTMWFEAPLEQIGQEHYLFCAEYCGEQHSQMAAIIKVLSEADYQQWKVDNRLDDNLSPVDLGRQLYITKGCNACHQTDVDAIGPKWEGVYGSTRQFTDNTSAVADENYLRESILVPAAKVVAGYPNQMASYQGQLTDRELTALISFIKSLSDVGRAELEAVAAEAGEGEGEAGEAAPADGQEQQGSGAAEAPGQQ